ncbi:hypothetical protein AAEX63_06000 [Luteococcus sp. H138]|uniref:hypothetical protein n=1 Tax=unclassified Luteococcus TaxID=2639923 RepID=UPI00313E3043
MKAIIVALVGVAIMTTVLVSFFWWLRRRDLVHHFIADHDFVHWVDVFRLEGRSFGSQTVGHARRCYRALADGLPVELVVEELPVGHAHRQRWLLAARVPQGTAFAVTADGVEGTLPEVLDAPLHLAHRDQRIDAVLCEHGLLLVRLVTVRGLEPGLALLRECVERLRSAGR